MKWVFSFTIFAIGLVVPQKANAFHSAQHPWTIVVDTISKKTFLELKSTGCRELDTTRLQQGVEMRFGLFTMPTTNRDAILSVMFLEDNVAEAFSIDRYNHIAKIVNKKGKAIYQRFTIKENTAPLPVRRDEHPNKRGVMMEDGTVVDILEVGNDYVSDSPDASLRDTYRNVKISHKGKARWVDGRTVYGIYESDQNWQGTVGNKRIEVKAAGYYGVPSTYEGARGCDNPNMLVFIENGVEHAVQLPGTQFGWLRLDCTGESVRWVKNVTKCGDAYNITIHARFFESCEDIVYRVRPTKKGPWEAACCQVFFYDSSLGTTHYVW